MGRAQYLALPLLLAGLACAGDAGSSGFDADSLRTDDTGYALRFERRPERIVSLIPTATEILFAIGAGPRLLARTDYCNYPPEARRLPSVGDGIRPAVEPILAFRPDLVVMFAGPDNAPSIERLRALGVPVFAVYHNSLPDLYRN
ncbi:MAG: ABC transporter substrate-binding protein, partial [Gemmatimonadetes bacterium]|nr:ABC transporter substrate-binding protein [Gemmatimonadota bacterium]